MRPGYLTNYIESSAEENSALGWETVLKNIKRVSDSDFKKHAKKFYSFEGLPQMAFPGVIVMLLLIFLMFK